MTARKSIFDIIQDKYDIASEVIKIANLFNMPLLSYNNSYGYDKTTTIEFKVNEFFEAWKGRQNCINCEDMVNVLEIKDCLIRIENSKKASIKPDINDILVCIEYYYNILYIFDKKFIQETNRYTYNLSNKFTMMVENMTTLLDKLHHEKIYSKETEELILIPKDAAATAVAEISTEETGMAILMYHHRQLKGDLIGKRQLLQQMANEYEPILKEKLNGFTEIFKTTSGLLNNIHIRHNNLEGKHRKEGVVKMSDAELESWYDETYQLILFCVLAKDNVERKARADEIVKNVNAKSKATIDKQ